LQDTELGRMRREQKTMDCKMPFCSEKCGESGKSSRKIFRNGSVAPPLFFVSVASKGFRPSVSRLFAILAEKCISVAFKAVTGADCWR
jgi:hypothetical protein